MFREIPIIANNAIKDMLDEWVLTLCIILSIAAIACPLLILFGLKQGVVQSVRDEFIKDPVYREITPKETTEYEDQFFTELRSDGRVELVIPNITRSASVAQLEMEDGTKSRNVDVHPTDGSDPLLLMNAGVAPQESEMVITASLAKLFEVAVGDEIKILISRKFNGKRQTAVQSTKVVAVLNARANGKHGIYVPLKFAVDMESFRFGRQVDRAGWPEGTVPKTREVFDAMLVGCGTPIEADVVSRATIRTEFKEHTAIAQGEQALWPFTFSDAISWNVFRASGGPTSERNVKALKSELRGNGCKHTLHWVDNRGALVSGNAFDVYGMSLEKRDKGLFAEAPARNAGKSADSYMTAVASPNSGLAVNAVVDIVFPVGKSNITLPVTVSAHVSWLADNALLVPVELLARLRSGDSMALQYDDDSGELVVGEIGFSGFRAYANSIDDVPNLSAAISKLGSVEVLAKTDDIIRAKLLDAGLTKIVITIALVGLVGGAGALIASLIASVERKKTEMGTYRLIGFNRHSVAMFPVVQGAVISCLAIFLAGLFYVLFSGIVDQVLGTGGGISGEGGGIVKIEFVQFIVFTLGIIVLAVFCALIAARRSIRIEPAEALRQE